MYEVEQIRRERVKKEIAVITDLEVRTAAMDLYNQVIALDDLDELHLATSVAAGFLFPMLVQAAGIMQVLHEKMALSEKLLCATIMIVAGVFAWYITGSMWFNRRAQKRIDKTNAKQRTSMAYQQAYRLIGRISRDDWQTLVKFWLPTKNDLDLNLNKEETDERKETST
jgi:hypothetical protein